MSATFLTSASTRLINSSPPMSGYPITVCCWFMPFSLPASGDRTIWSIGIAGSNQWMALKLNTTSAVMSVNGSASVDTVIQTVNTGGWNFALLRFATATSRRAAFINRNFVYSQASGTTSSTVTGTYNRFSVGSQEAGAAGSSGYFDGLVAEFWYTATDIQRDAANLEQKVAWQIAFNGPFSVSRIVPEILEYRSFWRSLGTEYSDGEDVYTGSRGQQNWVNTNGVDVGPHPPLIEPYRRSSVGKLILPI
jgi:hypothetical protein